MRTRDVGGGMGYHTGGIICIIPDGDPRAELLKPQNIAAGNKVPEPGGKTGPLRDALFE